MDEKKILVSVVCLTYNHIDYIEKTLKSLVSQITDFAYEIIVHDDASTDGTDSIVRKFQDEYPHLIKSVLQYENQYQRNVSIKDNFIKPLIRGRYVAFCEGDDEWLDHYKLQKQVDFLEHHNDYSVCVTKAIKYFVKNKNSAEFPKLNFSKDFSTDEIIRIGGGAFATCTILLRTSVYLDIPSMFSMPGVGDYQLFIYASSVGKCHCLNDVTAKYNYGVDNSWTNNVYFDANKRAQHNEQLIACLNKMKDFYDGSYNDAFDFKIRETEYFQLLLQKKFLKILIRYFEFAKRDFMPNIKYLFKLILKKH